MARTRATCSHCRCLWGEETPGIQRLLIWQRLSSGEPHGTELRRQRDCQPTSSVSLPRCPPSCPGLQPGQALSILHQPLSSRPGSPELPRGAFLGYGPSDAHSHTLLPKIKCKKSPEGCVGRAVKTDSSQVDWGVRLRHKKNPRESQAESRSTYFHIVDRCGAQPGSQEIRQK